jgi:hypothetical protein
MPLTSDRIRFVSNYDKLKKVLEVAAEGCLIELRTGVELSVPIVRAQQRGLITVDPVPTPKWLHDNYHHHRLTLTDAGRIEHAALQAKKMVRINVPFKDRRGHIVDGLLEGLRYADIVQRWGSPPTSSSYVSYRGGRALNEFMRSLKKCRFRFEYTGLADDVVPVVDAGTLRESLPTDGTQHDGPSRDQTS